MRKRLSVLIERGLLWVVAQAGVLLLAAVLPRWSGAGRFDSGDWRQDLGVALAALGVVLTLWGLVSLGGALTPLPTPKAVAALHSEGAYRFLRHPIYAGLILGSFGWALWWASGIGTLYAVVVALFFDRKAAYEERWLRRRFQAYAGYQRRVRKFIPGIY